MSDVMEKMVEAACMANLNPLSEPSSVERKKMEKSLRAALPLLVEEMVKIADERARNSDWIDGRIEAGQIAGAIRSRFSEIMGERK